MFSNNLLGSSLEFDKIWLLCCLGGTGGGLFGQLIFLIFRCYFAPAPTKLLIALLIIILSYSRALETFYSNQQQVVFFVATYLICVTTRQVSKKQTPFNKKTILYLQITLYNKLTLPKFLRKENKKRAQLELKESAIGESSFDNSIGSNEL